MGGTVELQSRAEKHKATKRHHPAALGWLLFLFVYVAVLYALLPFARLPDTVYFRQMLQIGLFFCSILFLDLYLLAFTVASTKPVVQPDQAARAKPYIVVAWVLSVLYHFMLWMLSHQAVHPGYYYIGMAFTLAVFLLTLVHFSTYFSVVQKETKAWAKARNLENRRQAYEELKKIFYLYRLIREVTEEDAEVRHMMRWNFFDKKMEQMVTEIEPYMHTSHFSKEDLEKILGVEAWMENLMIIVEQHPRYQHLNKYRDR